MTSDLRRWLIVLALAWPLAASASPKTEAKTLFVQGLTSAKSGDYRLAVGQFLASWELYEHPTTAFNIAKSYEDYGDLDRALLWYRRFQTMAPSRASEAAEPILRLMEAKDPIPAATAPAPAEEVAPPAEEEAPPPPPAEEAPPERPKLTDLLDAIEKKDAER